VAYFLLSMVRSVRQRYVRRGFSRQFRKGDSAKLDFRFMGFSEVGGASRSFKRPSSRF
jgi:hypothetical protein